MNASTSSLSVVTVERQFDGLNGRPLSAVAAGTFAVPRMAPLVQVGTLMFVTDWNCGGPTGPSRKSLSHVVSSVAPLGKSAGEPSPWEIATEGMLCLPP